MGLNWKTCYLDPTRTDVITFYISVGIGGNEPAGKAFLTALAEGKTALSAKIPPAFQTTTVAPSPSQVSESEIETVYYENMPSVPDASSFAKKDDPSAEVTEASEKTPSVSAFVSKEQLDPEYIQRLLDHIAELENDGNVVNAAEIKFLNDELDAILNVLNGM